MVIGGIQKNSLIDYPGKISCVIFVAGCNFQCPYCHNPSLIHSHLTTPGFEIEEEEVFRFLDSRRAFFKSDCGPHEILSSIQLIMECGKDHEFRTTCVKPIINDRAIEGIARLIKGSHLYALQKFISKDVLRPEFFRGPGSGHSVEELFHFGSIAEKWVRKCVVR